MTSLAEVCYTREECTEASLVYFGGDELAASTWLSKYARRDAEGNFLEKTPEDMFRRLAREFARIENSYRGTGSLNGSSRHLSEYGRARAPLTQERIFALFDRFRYIVPQGSVMASLGNPSVLASLSNCVVLPEVYDSYGGIFFADQQLAQLFKRRCGAGVDLSSLRPSGHGVSNAAGSSTGAVSFMERFSATTREVAQNGRRGALMITMDVAHPDIEAFVTIKQDLTRVTGANISVKLTDEFMKAVESGSDFTLRWPVDSPNPEVVRTIRARDLWDTIIHCAHKTAEPGLLFWDRQHTYSTSSLYPGFKNVSTNPCSEIAMQGGDSCRLIALNLLNFVEHPFTQKAAFDYHKFYEVTYEAQRLMDDLVDLELECVERIISKVESDPEPEYIRDAELRTWKLLAAAGRRGRRTGLGFTALADTLAALGFVYDSEEALAEAEKISKIKCEAEFDSSIDMALERGKFEDFNPDTEAQSEFVQMLARELPQVHNRMMKHGRRNISLSTVAPTGTISLLTRTSSGIEPVFQLAYKRRRKIARSSVSEKADFVDALGDAWHEFDVFHPPLRTWMETTGHKDTRKSPWRGSTANEIDWMKRIRMQAVVQKFVTHSISSTINLPSGVTAEQVGEIYFAAWKQGLKGITVYRDGSRAGVLISSETKTDVKKEEKTIADKVAPPRPKSLEAEVIRFSNQSEKWLAVVGLLEGRPYEIFTGRAEDAFALPASVQRGWVVKNKNASGKSRYDFQYLDKEGYKVTIEGLSRSFDKEYWNYAKLLSGVLRQGMPVVQVVDLIDHLNLYSDNINTWKAGVVRALKKFIPDGAAPKDKTCASCGDPEGLVFEEGCLKCRSCGASKCG